MHIILSPAKNMDIQCFKNIPLKQPIFKEKTTLLHKELKKLNPQDIGSLMKVNEEIAFKTFRNFADFNIEQENGHSILSYNGLVFKNINPIDFSNEDINFAENTIRILSGFYGILTPLTNISAYRLEMLCKLSINNYKNLYEFWSDTIYNELLKKGKPIINLASKEYTKTITPFLKENDIFINIDFLTIKNGKYRVIATSAKMARGKMTRYIIKNKITNIEDLKEFSFDGYKYNEYLSNKKNFVFLT